MSGLHVDYEDANGGCPNVTASTRASFLQMAPGNYTDHFSYYKQALTFQVQADLYPCNR